MVLIGFLQLYDPWLSNIILWDASEFWISLLVLLEWLRILAFENLTEGWDFGAFTLSLSLPLSQLYVVNVMAYDLIHDRGPVYSWTQAVKSCKALLKFSGV